MATTGTINKIAELKQKITELEESLLVPEKSKEDLMEELFLDLINNSKYKIEGEYNIWSNIKDEWIMVQDKKSKDIWFQHYRFWSIFSLKFNDNIQVTRDFLSTMVVKHLDLHGYTPFCSTHNISREVVKHLDLHGYTPVYKLGNPYPRWLNI